VNGSTPWRLHVHDEAEEDRRAQAPPHRSGRIFAAGPESGFVTGASLTIDGGYTI
jgi:hypothetical protein